MMHWELIQRDLFDKETYIGLFAYKSDVYAVIEHRRKMGLTDSFFVYIIRDYTGVQEDIIVE